MDMDKMTHVIRMGELTTTLDMLDESVHGWAPTLPLCLQRLLDDSVVRLPATSIAAWCQKRIDRITSRRSLVEVTILFIICADVIFSGHAFIGPSRGSAVNGRKARTLDTFSHVSTVFSQKEKARYEMVRTK